MSWTWKLQVLRAGGLYIKYLVQPLHSIVFRPLTFLHRWCSSYFTWETQRNNRRHLSWLPANHAPLSIHIDILSVLAVMWMRLIPPVHRITFPLPFKETSLYRLLPTPTSSSSSAVLSLSNLHSNIKEKQNLLAPYFLLLLLPLSLLRSITKLLTDEYVHYLHFFTTHSLFTYSVCLLAPQWIHWIH